MPTTWRNSSSPPLPPPSMSAPITSHIHSRTSQGTLPCSTLSSAAWMLPRTFSSPPTTPSPISPCAVATTIPTTSSTHKKDKTITPSNGSERTKQKIAKLQRKTTRRKENYNNTITKRIVDSSSFIGVETLNITGMFRNKHLAYALSDASMGQILEMIKYKSAWYGRKVQAIDQYTASSKRCHCCGHIEHDFSLSITRWTCPQCGVVHDRDINAAKNILYYALCACYGDTEGTKIFNTYLANNQKAA